MADILPTRRQVEFQEREFGLFLHFGIRTFYEGYRDFDDRTMSPDRFLPSALDCGQWAEVARRAGVRYAVMTAKHHDGFALWPSRTTAFSVAASPWKDGRGDVVREFVDAFRREGIAVGLYYSPFDAASPVYGDEGAYDDFFVAQVSELLEPYGPIDILWLDGCGSAGHTYDWPRIVAEIRRRQPEILLFNMGDPEIRWIGNEDGFAPSGTRNDVDGRWFPAECDARMRDRNWFYSDADGDTVKAVDELVGMYYHSVGRGCNLLLNIGPDRRGVLPERDAANLVALGEEIRRRFSRPLATLADMVRDGLAWEYRAEPHVVCDHAVLAEDIARGEHVRRFALRAEVGGPDPITLAEGTAIGHKAIMQFPAIRARRIRFEVLEADGDVRLRSFDLFRAGG